MPHTADPEIDRSRDARQKRYERHVTAVDHVEDDAFQDKWRGVRDERSEVQTKINAVNKKKAPIMVRVRELKKAKDQAGVKLDESKRKLNTSKVLPVFNKLIKGRSMEVLQLYADALNSVVKEDEAKTAHATQSDRNDELETALASKSAQKIHLSGELDQVFDLYQQRMDKKRSGASLLPVIGDLHKVSGDTLNLSDDEEASQASLSANDNLRMRLENMVMKSLRDNVFDLSEKMEVEEFMDRKSIPRSTFFEILSENGWTRTDYFNGSKVDVSPRPRKRHAAGGAAAQVQLYQSIVDTLCQYPDCVSQLTAWNRTLKPSKHQAGGSDEDGGPGRLDGADLDV